MSFIRFTRTFLEAVILLHITPNPNKLHDLEPYLNISCFSCYANLLTSTTHFLPYLFSSAVNIFTNHFSLPVPLRNVRKSTASTDLLFSSSFSHSARWKAKQNARFEDVYARIFLIFLVFVWILPMFFFFVLFMFGFFLFGFFRNGTQIFDPSCHAPVTTRFGLKIIRRLKILYSCFERKFFLRKPCYPVLDFMKLGSPRFSTGRFVSGK